jgi:hypothetical protein
MDERAKAPKKTPAGFPPKGVDAKKLTAALDAIIEQIDEDLLENAAW